MATTQTATADAAGIHATSYTRYIKRRQQPPLDVLQAMAKALHCKVVLAPLSWRDHDYDHLLGTMHDKDIAAHADITVQAIAKRRTKMGIPAYKHTQAASHKS